MPRKTSYTGKDIKVLTDFEHVRKRTNVYLGNTTVVEAYVPIFGDDGFAIKTMSFIPAVYKAIGEIIDNSVDELTQIDQSAKKIVIEGSAATGMYSVKDNGRGVPIDVHESGKYTPEVVFGSLRSGRNFDERETGVIGMNGVGSSCVVACSTTFHTTIYRDGKRYIQKFENGGLKISKPSITTAEAHHPGTEVSFQLDPEVFLKPTIPDQLLQNRGVELAFNNPGFTIECNGAKYKFKNGLEDLLKQYGCNFYKFEIDHSNIQGTFFIVQDLYEGLDESIFTWVNSSLLFDGGLINTQFFNAFNDATIEWLKKDAKKNGCEVTKNDVKRDMLIFGTLKIKEPTYDSQAKTRLTGPNFRNELQAMVAEQYKKFASKNQTWLDAVLERANDRHHSQADKEATKEHKKNLGRRIPKLQDATSTVRSNCQLLITEGDSAKAKISEARDPVTTAALPLMGKVNNVYGITVAQLLKMEKITNLLAAIGLTPGEKAMRSQLRYGKIVVATDADFDGDDIFTLLVNLFFQFWPELFDKNYEPIVHRLVAPNICLVKGKQRIHFARRDDYEKVKDKYKGYEVRYYKGLGSMVREDWEMILSGKTDTMIPVIDVDGKMKETLKLLFDDQLADKRKEWLST